MDCEALWNLVSQLQNMYWNALWAGDWDSLSVVIWALLEVHSMIARGGC